MVWERRDACCGKLDRPWVSLPSTLLLELLSVGRVQRMKQQGPGELDVTARAIVRQKHVAEAEVI